MNTDLEGILALNTLDQEIASLRRKRIELPKEIERIKAEIAGERHDLDELLRRIGEFEAEGRRLEEEIREHRDGFKKSEDKLMLIKTNEEYDAVHTEIATRKTKIAEGEERVLQVMAEKEKLESRRAETEAKVNTEDNVKRLEALKALETDYQNLEDRVNVLEAQRVEKAKSVGNRYLQVYERLHRIKKNGFYVGQASDKRRSCGVCGCALTPQRFIEVKRNNTINTCEACGSILIWVPEAATEAKA